MGRLVEADERLGNGAEVAHPEEVVVANAGAVEITEPESIQHLLADLAGISGEAFDLPEVAIHDLTIFRSEESEGGADGTNKWFHWGQYSMKWLWLAWYGSAVYCWMYGIRSNTARGAAT